MKDRNQLYIRRRTIKHTIRVLMSTAQSAHDNKDKIRLLEKQLRDIEEQLRSDT